MTITPKYQQQLEQEPHINPQQSWMYEITLPRNLHISKTRSGTSVSNSV
jgi:hypothetical protein